ncbi:alanine racemase [Virgibacillus siamensis]|uniref:alanine racemase n=1 Tax=Virgibacillus siamensis TaxID=480071 RepID=UPI000985DC2B|nr:alanine racemase [Virgibacillus siamensis]
MQHSAMITSHNPTVAEVDLHAFHRNVQQLRKLTGNGSMLMAVIKTNAYGHGVVPIGKAAVNAGADRLGVTGVEEGALLRESGINVPIHILSSITLEQASDVMEYGLTPFVASKELAEKISTVAEKQHTTVPVHVKIDTGLHRFGIDPQDVLSFCETCYSLPGIRWEGIYTHFSSADEGEWKKTEHEYQLFLDTVSELENYGFHFPVKHVAASTITIERPDMHLNMVRPGIALFGYPPAPRQKKIVDLEPVMRLQSKLVRVRELPPNTPVGYGGSYITKDTEKIAVVPIGLGDGYHRALSNKGQMIVRGKRARIVGAIALDQTLIDVSHIEGVTEGDTVTIMGKQGDKEIFAPQIADWMNSNVDEVLSSLMQRIQREYS